MAGGGDVGRAGAIKPVCHVSMLHFTLALDSSQLSWAFLHPGLDPAGTQQQRETQ